MKIVSTRYCENSCSHLAGFFPDGQSPLWRPKEFAGEFENAQEVIDQLNRTGYSFYQAEIEKPDGWDDERKSILARMKSGLLSKEEGVQMLRGAAGVKSD